MSKPAPEDRMTNAAWKLINQIEKATIPLDTNDRRETLCALGE
jgi:hypothetical protein